METPVKRLLACLFLAPVLLAQAPAGLRLGDPCPAFSLPGTDGKLHGPESPAPLMVVFLSTECPYVMATQDRINAYAKKYAGRVGVFGITR